MQMQIKEAKMNSDKIVITTTSAEFIIWRNTIPARIECSQLIGNKRLRTILTIPNISFTYLEIQHQDIEKAVLQLSTTSASFLRIEINADSTLIIYPSLKLDFIECEGNWMPEWTVHEDGNILLFDKSGGVCFLFENAKGLSSLWLTPTKWTAVFSVERFHEFFVSVCPPKERDIARAHDVIIQTGIAPEGCSEEGTSPYPSDSQIEKFARHGNILMPFSIWKGRFDRNPTLFPDEADWTKKSYLNSNWTSYRYEPLDEREWRRVIQTVHRNKMKILGYTSPHYCTAKGDDFLSELTRLMTEYELDGLYFDELFLKNTKEAYTLVKKTRKLLGDRLLYIHCTGVSRNLFCPFVDTYADYFLRGEGYYPFDDYTLKYYLSGYNISNSIGHVCTYNYPLEYVKELIQPCLNYNVRIPLWPVHNSLDDPQSRLLLDKYFPKLKCCGALPQK